MTFVIKTINCETKGYKYTALGLVGDVTPYLGEIRKWLTKEYKDQNAWYIKKNKQDDVKKWVESKNQEIPKINFEEFLKL